MSREDHWRSFRALAVAAVARRTRVGEAFRGAVQKCWNSSRGALEEEDSWRRTSCSVFFSEVVARNKGRGEEQALEQLIGGRVAARKENSSLFHKTRERERTLEEQKTKYEHGQSARSAREPTR